jgi:hypothetical protein
MPPHVDDDTPRQIPFADFALTNAGQISEQQLTMMRERVRTVGVSVMLPVSPTEGKQVASLEQDHPFDLGIESCASELFRARPGLMPSPGSSAPTSKGSSSGHCPCNTRPCFCITYHPSSSFSSSSGSGWSVTRWCRSECRLPRLPARRLAPTTAGPASLNALEHKLQRKDEV